MKLFEIANGYTGESHVHVLCIAESKDKALEMAQDRFREEAIKEDKYPADYYKNLSAKQLCADVSYGFCSEIYD